MCSLDGLTSAFQAVLFPIGPGVAIYANRQKRCALGYLIHMIQRQSLNINLSYVFKIQFGKFTQRPYTY
jgi:hypothetical protein